ncbi:MAG: glycine cleavage system protein GcvH [Deferribacteres bacterium]|nr:glycine cleavage system protein GcvH [candidate division KSB1 bacterium]MCB9510911.1 glycine cleavage system protein GcvH [Deferribacteres bacterium]
MNVPAELKFTQEHEWVKLEGNVATVGITDYAQAELSDVVFVELPEVGDSVENGETFGTIEAVKALSELFSPISGKVVAVNDQLADSPELVNSDPYGDGWMIKVEVGNPASVDSLLSADDYKNLIS